MGGGVLSPLSWLLTVGNPTLFGLSPGVSVTADNPGMEYEATN